MARCLRLSNAEFSRLNIRNAGSQALQGHVFAKKTVKPRHAVEIIRLVSTAKFSFSKLMGGIELRFEGARLATLNDLLAMSVHERRGYRNAWHKLIQEAALAEFNGKPPYFPCAAITVTRFGPRPVDRDAIIPKAPIDGLRYAGFLPDDTAEVVRGLSLNQAIGSYTVQMQLLKIEHTN